MSHPLARPRGFFSRRLALEPLEDRSLLSAAPAINLPSVHLDPTKADTSNILVQFRPNATPAALPGTTLGQALPLVPGLVEVMLNRGTTVDQALTDYRANSQVLTAEPNYNLDASWVPNDPQFGELWNLRNTGQSSGTVRADVRATAAWDVATDSRRVPVAVIDSGIDYTHPDLYLNIWLNQGEIPASRRANLIDVDGDRLITFRDLNTPQNQGPGKITDLNKNGYIDGGDLLKPMTKDASGNDTGKGGWADGVSQDGDTYVDDLVGWNSNANTNVTFDDYGHGTHVAGTIGAQGNNGVGVAGITWKSQLVPVKFFDKSGHGTMAQFIAGLDWALSKGIKVSNNSWNDPGYTPLLDEAVARARDRGHIFIAAAGNHARNADLNPAYPAGFTHDNILSVAATDRNDNLARFSNYGKTSVDIAAPGVDVYSTTPWARYGLRTGTSMAVPHVTGVVAMVWALRPEWNYRQVIDWVLQTADRLPGLEGKVASGRLNAAAAFRVPPRGGGVRPSAVLAQVASMPTGETGAPRPSSLGLEEIAGLLARRDKSRG